MAAIINWPSPNGMPMASGDQAFPSTARQTSPDARYHAPTANSAFGSSRQEAKMPRLNRICQRPGSIHKLSGAKRANTNGISGPATTAGRSCAREVVEGGMKHLVGQTGMQTPRPRDRLCTNQRNGKDRRANPDGEITSDLLARMIQRQSLNARREQGEQSRECHGCWAVAAKLRSACHLGSDGIYVRKRLVQIRHPGASHLSFALQSNTCGSIEDQPKSCRQERFGPSLKCLVLLRLPE